MSFEEAKKTTGIAELRTICAVCRNRTAAVYCVQDQSALCLDCDRGLHCDNSPGGFGEHERISLLMKQELKTEVEPLACTDTPRWFDDNPRYLRV